MEDDEILITVVDETANEFEDVSVLLYDDYCHIRQWSEDEQFWTIITMTSEMYYEMMMSWKSKSGAYVIR